MNEFMNNSLSLFRATVPCSWLALTTARLESGQKRESSLSSSASTRARSFLWNGTRGEITFSVEASTTLASFGIQKLARRNNICNSTRAQHLMSIGKITQHLQRVRAMEWFMFAKSVKLPHSKLLPVIKLAFFLPSSLSPPLFLSLSRTHTSSFPFLTSK